MSLKTFKKGTGLAVVSAGLMLSGAVQAAAMTDAAVSGLSIGWFESAGVLSPTLNPAAGDLATLLSGDASFAGGNIELGQRGSDPATTLSGKLGAETIVLSSLVDADWTANGNELAVEYVTNAAASVGAMLTPAERDAIVNDLLGLDLSTVNPAVPVGTTPSNVLSDTNISYVERDGALVKIGLAGFLDASTLFSAWFGVPVQGAQASEVVKVTYDGMTDYLYSFSAVASGVTADNGQLVPTLTPPFFEVQGAGNGLAEPGESYSGTYEVTLRAVPEPVPVPATLALLALGTLLMKRRSA